MQDPRVFISTVSIASTRHEISGLVAVYNQLERTRQGLLAIYHYFTIFFPRQLFTQLTYVSMAGAFVLEIQVFIVYGLLTAGLPAECLNALMSPRRNNKLPNVKRFYLIIWK